MKKIITKISAAVFALSLFCGTSFITSCNNFQDQIETNSKAYISLGSASARTILPAFDTENFSNYVLKGSFNGGEETLIGTWDSLDAVHAEILAGTWDFTLTAKNGSALLEGKISGKAIISGNNVLNFIMDVKSYGSSNSYGSVNVSVNVPDSVKSIKAGLYNVETGKVISDFKQEALEITGYSAAYQKSIVPAGTYTIKFFMYGDEEGSVLLNTYSEIVIVASNAASNDSEEITTVNSAYTIEYDLGKGSAKNGKTFPSLYSILTSVLLPSENDLDYPDHIFSGWYESSDFSSSPVTEIKAGSQTGNKKYFARWAIQGNFTLEASTIATKIDSLEADGAYNIKATGACSEDDIIKIRNVIAGRSDIIVNLDLSATSGLKNLPANAFQNCTSLHSIILPSTITTMGAGIFAGCSNLVSITIPFIGTSATATTASADTLFGVIFGTTAFTGATATTQNYGSSKVYYIPDSLRSVTVLGGKMLYGAFYGCAKLTTINLPSDLTEMGNRGLYGCTNLKDFTLPSGLTKIGQYEFTGCSSITALTIPKNVATIDTYAFNNVENLKTVTFETGSVLTAIGSNTFTDSKKLESVDFSKTKLTTLGSSAFSNCSSLVNVNLSSGSLTTINTTAFLNCTSLTTIVIPSTVTSIAGSVFRGCSALTNLTLPFIGSSSTTATYRSSSVLFGYIFGSTSYTGSTAISQTYYSSSTSNSTTTIKYYIPSSLTNLTITGASGKQAVYNYAFIGCTQNLNVTLNSGIINPYAFASFTGLKTFTFGKAYTNIAEYMFSGCSGLTSVSVKLSSGGKIGNYAFNGCSLLNTVNIPDGTASIGSNAFYNCKALPSITIPSSVTTIDSYAFRNCSSLTTVTIPESVTTMGTSIFYDCASLQKVTLPEGITKIPSNTFYGCTVLADISIPSTVTSIDSSAFSKCTNLKSITIPDAVTSIGASAFAGCSGLTEMSVPFVGSTKGATAAAASTLFGYWFGTSSYTGCTSTTQYYASSSSTAYYIPNGLKKVTVRGGSILYGAFYNCTKIELLNIDESVTSIGTNAFYNVPVVHYHGKLTSTNNWGAKTINLTKFEVITPSTCTVHGVGNKICQTCGKVIEQNVELELLPHSLNENSVCTVCGNEIPTWVMTSTSSYPWKASGTTWTSSNKGVSSSSSSSTWTIVLNKEISYTFQYRVSSESGYDKLTVTLDGTTIASAISGNGSLTTKTVTLTAGTHKITATYSKDGSNNTKNDCGTLILPEITY